MPIDLLTRRDVVARLSTALALTGLAIPAARADAPIDLLWDDLIPEEHRGLMMETLRDLGVVQHGELSTPFDQKAASAVVTDYNGQLVRIPGYAVPLEFSGRGITAFILVPFIGACVHVPPPPANQLIFVTPTEPFEADDMWDPIYATGTFSTSAVGTELAEIGYAMTDARVEPYG